jgi:hypothetical protein
MRSSPSARWAVVASALAIVACGSSSSGSLFSNGTASGGAGGTSTSSGGTSSSSGGRSTSSGGASSEGGGGVGGAQGGGFPGSGGLSAAGGFGGVAAAGGFGFGGVASGGLGGSAGTAGAVSSGGQGGSPPGHVACEAASCSAPTGEHCCFASGVAAHCYGGSLGGQCSCGILCTTIVVECDGPEDCTSGKLCCGEMSLTDSVYTHLYCRTNCASGITSTLTEICHLGRDTCMNGNSCSNDGLVPAGYGDCG